MQGNNYGLLVKTIKKFPKSPFRPAGRVLTFDKTKFARLNIENLLCLGFIPFIYQSVYGFVTCNLYCNSEWHLRAAFWVLLHRGWKLNNWNTIIHYSLLFSPDYSLFILNFSVIFVIHFLVFMSVFLFKFPFCELHVKKLQLWY